MLVCILHSLTKVVNLKFNYIDLDELDGEHACPKVFTRTVPGPRTMVTENNLFLQSLLTCFILGTIERFRRSSGLYLHFTFSLNSILLL